MFFRFKQKTAYEMRISDWSSDVCSSDLMRPDIAIEDDARRIVVDQRPLAMLALGMARVGEALGGEIVRKADVVTRPLPPLLDALAGEARARRRHILVDPPQEGAVIHEDILRSDGREARKRDVSGKRVYRSGTTD